MDVFTKLACIQISVVILLYAWFLAKIIGAWSHPAVIYAVFWFAMTFLPLVAVFSAPVAPWAMVYIFGTVIAFSLPALIYDWSESIAIARSRQSQLATGALFTPLLPIFFVMQICTIAFVFVNLSIQGYTAAEFVADPIRASNRYLSARYSGTIHANLFSQAGIVLNYIAAAIGGLVIAQQKTRIRIILVGLFTFTPSLLHMTIYADKGTLFLVGAYFFGGVIGARVTRGDTSLVNMATLKVATIAFALVMPFIIFTMVSRGGGDWTGSERIAKVIFYLNTYAFGHLFAFSDWFTDYFFGEGSSFYTNPQLPTNGFFTFMSIGHLVLPGYQILPGVFDEYFTIPGLIKTNIYTIFRSLITDFGLIGSLVILSLWGLVASLTYNAMLRKRTAPLSQSFFILTIGWIYTSYIISLLIWNSAYASAIGVTVLLIANSARAEWSRLVRTEASIVRPEANP